MPRAGRTATEAPALTGAVLAERVYIGVASTRLRPAYPLVQATFGQWDARRRMRLTVVMRASRQEQVGGAGVSAVSEAFERLGWGVAENARHDVGTDLLVFARDERRFDLGLVVGVQVKAGGSYFREPARDMDGAALGWWFRDADRAHVDAWVSHGLPHLIVLHCPNTRTSYWVHVTADVVKRAGRGAKVLVPKANTVDDEHRDALLGVAVAPRPRVEWEGSAWTGAATLAPRDLLRHALVVPRLVAPHPNVGHRTPVTPEQAVALLVQERGRDLVEFAATHADVPNLAVAAESPQWSWRFVGALADRLTTGEIGGLLAVAEDAPDPAKRTAATVTVAAGLLEEGRADQAITRLEAALAFDDAEPVDHAWLTVQHARACAEVGRMDEAHAGALDVQKIRVTHPGDVTGTAIAGVAAVLLFNTSAWEQHNVADVVTGMDTTASWWRTQTMSWGLVALTERTFKGWARDTSVTWGGVDVVRKHLISASLTANYVADHGGWRHLSGLLGRDALMRLERDADPEIVRRGLDTLRLAGDEDALKLAVLRIAANGPASAIALAAADVDLEVSTHTTGPADLALLQYGGDLIDEATADRSMGWLLASLRDSSKFRARTNPSYLLPARLVGTLTACVLAASPRSRRLVVNHLMSLPAQKDWYLAAAWAEVVNVLPDKAWDEGAALRVGKLADSFDSVLRLPLLGVSARYDATAREQLVEAAAGGSLDALAVLGDVQALPTEAVHKLIAVLTELADKQVSDARSGSFRGGGHDVGYALALLNVWHPEAANWVPLLNLLQETTVIGKDKRGALRLLADLVKHLPNDVRPRLGEISVAVARQPVPVHAARFGNHRDAVGAAADLAAALGGLNDDEGADRLLELLSGDSDHRCWAARVASRLARPADTGVLVVLAHDPEPEVRATAASGLASLVATARGGELAVNVLQRCLQDPGTKVPLGIALTLAGVSDRSPDAEVALTVLRGHASAYVRTTATGANEQ